MKPANVLRLYLIRVRSRLLRECFAVVGIAAGVALLFASQVASSSLQNSVAELSRGVAGRATLQLRARDPHGFPGSMLARVRGIPGVRAAAPVLEANANAVGPRGSRSVELIGADASLSGLGGSLVRHTALTPFGNIGAVVLPAPFARAIGVTRFGQEVTFQVDGRSTPAPLYEQLGKRQVGSLTNSPIAIVPLSFMQEITGLPGRVGRILVQVAPGSRSRVRAALIVLAGGRLNVEPVDYDEKLFAKAAAASNQSTYLFAVISALVGFLFAFNAMLLTVPQRRQLVIGLRRDGYTPGTVAAVLVLDALALGVVASVLGLALGEGLSIGLFHSDPAFLSLAFAVGSQRAVSAQSIAIAVGGGLSAALVAVLSPLRDILSRDPLVVLGPRPDSMARQNGVWRALAGLACLAGASAILLEAPQATTPGMILLVAALLLELPIALTATLGLTRRIALTARGTVPHLATMELNAVRTRAIAIAATGATAIFGSVAIQGAHENLLAGLEGAASVMNASTDLWVSPAGSYDLYKTAQFTPTRQQQVTLARLPGVRAVRIYHAGLLDYSDRRVLVIAPPSAANTPLPRSQILQGNADLANTRLRIGGWAVLSKAMAEEHHLKIGQPFTLPSPRPTRLRVAALSTNLTWAPGAIVMNPADYTHAWDSTDASAYSIQIDHSADGIAVANELKTALGANSALTVQSANQHVAEQNTLDRQALQRLSQIATLIPIAAVLAMAAAIGAMIWQRRPRLAKLKLEGLARQELWRTILLESLLLLAAGSLVGSLLGICGQLLADHALANTVNFPIHYSLTALPILKGLALMAITSLLALAIPGYLAARVPASAALQD